MLAFKYPVVRVVSLLLGCAVLTPASAQLQNDHLIVPDTRIGPISLGMSDKDLFKFGVPVQTASMGDKILYRYEDLDVFVGAVSHSVMSISLKSNEQYHTSEGVKIGSSLSDVEGAMGPPDKIVSWPFACCPTEDAFYRSHRMDFDFASPGSSMADRPTDIVQEIKIQIAGAGVF